LTENRSATNANGNFLISPMQKVSITPGRPPIRKKSINEEYFHEKRRLEKELLEKNNQIEDMQYQIGEKEEKFKELGNLILKFKLCLLRNYKKIF
jgi:peptidoglycan hydrolase CwlO-like protein